ncbi:MAG: ABC transporter ATP-binding protein [Chloroflexi bacterium]|nr:ABC transporter ATP-binding protein [Chloroflexota bacterium]
MIQVEGLTKYYLGDQPAISNLSFYADRGEIVGFLGPNGAGKTTTMRILTGYMPASAGKAIVAGYDVMRQSIEVRQRVGYLPETVPLYKDITVWQYLDYMAGLHGMTNPDRTDRVEEVLDQVDMLDRADSLVANISKGMRQRVGLAQAIVHNPDVLILDEPMVGLDPDQRREVRELIQNLGEARTVMLSSHDLAEVEKVCTRVLVINRGRIVAEDSPEALANNMQGMQRFYVRVDNDAAGKLKELVMSVEGVAEAKVDDRKGGLEVIATRDSNARPAVAALIVSNNLDLLELRPLDMSLEDIFLQLTAEAEAELADEDEWDDLDDDEFDDLAEDLDEDEETK